MFQSWHIVILNAIHEGGKIIKGSKVIPLSELTKNFDKIDCRKDTVFLCEGTFEGGECSASPAAGKIVIAAGFQGIDEDLNITTLGRGGSDTTAVALAYALEADVCEILTDVENEIGSLE